MRRQRQNLHRPDAAGSAPPTGDHPCLSLHKVRLGTPTGIQHQSIETCVFNCNLVQVGSVCSCCYLSRHDFCIGATNLDSSIKTGSIVSLHNISTIGLISSDAAVVRACRDTPNKPWSQQVENQIGTNSNTNTIWKPSVPCGPGKPLEGQPNGWPSVPRMVYSCSIPNQGCWSFTISINFLHEIRRLVSGREIKKNPVRQPSRSQLCFIVPCPGSVAYNFILHSMCRKPIPNHPHPH